MNEGLSWLNQEQEILAEPCCLLTREEDYLDQC